MVSVNDEVPARSVVSLDYEAWRQRREPDLVRVIRFQIEIGETIRAYSSRDMISNEELVRIVGPGRGRASQLPPHNLFVKRARPQQVWEVAQPVVHDQRFAAITCQTTDEPNQLLAGVPNSTQCAALVKWGIIAGCDGRI
jgi:hypothetical protein